MKKIIEKPFGKGKVSMDIFLPYMVRRSGLSKVNGGNQCTSFSSCCWPVRGKKVCVGGFASNCYNFQCSQRFKTVAVWEPL